MENSTHLYSNMVDCSSSPVGDEPEEGFPNAQLTLARSTQFFWSVWVKFKGKP